MTENANIHRRILGSGGMNAVFSDTALLRAALEFEAVHARDAGASPWMHYGSTSQDVIDTAFVFCLRRAMAVLARTLLQPAPPTTFGFKAGGWAHGLEEGRVGLGGWQSEWLILPQIFEAAGVKVRREVLGEPHIDRSAKATTAVQ